jgi:hypothetical protein
MLMMFVGDVQCGATVFEQGTLKDWKASIYLR